ncbi:MAG: MAPEG family protein [Gammaproteobacteria bacterium]|nr:MAPEG family protein [Gammaproteobacteria bacterium]
MDLVYLVIALALLQFFFFGGMVGRARVKYEVAAPSTSGNDVYERYFRVHYNTMEQLVVFIPAILLFGHYLSPNWAAAIGVIYLIGRFIYFRAYVTDPPKRGLGFGLSMLPIAILLLGGLGAAIWAVLT